MGGMEDFIEWFFLRLHSMTCWNELVGIGVIMLSYFRPPLQVSYLDFLVNTSLLLPYRSNGLNS